LSDSDKPEKKEGTLVRPAEGLAPDPDTTALSQPGPEEQTTSISAVDPDKTALSQVDTESTLISQPPAFIKSSSFAPNQTTLLKPDKDLKPGMLGSGTIIRDRFVIESLLGSGGMGAVYRAVDLRKHEAGDNEPYIAIKLLAGNFRQHSEAFVTLQREAKKTQVLAHPNIVTVYDFDRDGDLIYLTMEELKGDSLSDILKGKSKRKLSYKDKVAIIDQIAKGLSYAHRKGIVHSDLKPANIFYTDKGEVKILDFGIARAANEELYQDNFDAGKLGALTFAYASLEMIQFDPPHPSDDIYALGIIACELLDGAHPYERKDARQVLRNKIRAKKLHIKNPFLRRCLMQAIELRRDHRIRDAQQFLKKFHWSRTAPQKLSLIALLVLVGIAANVMYIQTIEPETIPFDSLTQEQQAQFHKYIQDGETALKFEDLEGAVVAFNHAYEIHQSNPDIRRAKKVVINILNKNLQQARPEDKPFVQQQIDALKQYPAFADDPKK